MAENDRGAPQAPQAPQGRQSKAHAPAYDPEQHLLHDHKLSIRIQGKEGVGGYGVWALVREERGKVKTLAVQKGTRRAAVVHFYDYVHPEKPGPAPAPARRPMGPRPRSGPRPPRRP